jgi:hypothetical protein
MKNLHGDSDSFSEFSQDPYIDIVDHTVPGEEMCGPGLSNSCNILMTGKYKYKW